MSSSAPGRAGGDELTHLGIVLLVAGIAVAGLLRLAGSLSAYLTGADQPTVGLTGALQVLTDPGTPATALQAPGLAPVTYWLVVAILLALAIAITVALWRVFRATPQAGDGFATKADIAKHASTRALLRRSAHLRPTLSKPTPQDVGYRLGTIQGKPVWASVEDSMLLVGPPRSGKGHNVIINMILDAPGAVISTSTRPDTIAITIRARRRRGPVAIFDPQHRAPGVPAGLRWSPVRGCQNVQTAKTRARGLAAAAGFGNGSENGGYWEGLTRQVLEQLLHAAALGGRDAADLYAWSRQPAAAADAVAILTSHPAAAPGWGEDLNAAINNEPRTRDSVWGGVKTALASLSDPDVVAAVTPHPGEQFDPETFIRSGGTLYLLGTSAGSGGVGPLVAAFVEDLTETAKRLASRFPGARLDPPLLLALDEIGNLAPLPSLPQLMSDGGGSGITVLPVLQSIAQARTAWGEHQTGTIWDAAIAKIILGGSAVARDLSDWSTLLGDRDEITYATSMRPDGTKTTQSSIRRRAIMSSQEIRTMPQGTGLILLRSLKPIQVKLQPWTKRKDGRRLRADKHATEKEISGLGRNAAVKHTSLSQAQLSQARKKEQNHGLDESPHGLRRRPLSVRLRRHASLALRRYQPPLRLPRSKRGRQRCGGAVVGPLGPVAPAGDNAAMESFISLLQKNVLNRGRWATREEVRLAIATWIERTYHRRRRQARLARVTPIEYETINTPSGRTCRLRPAVTDPCSGPTSCCGS